MQHSGRGNILLESEILISLRKREVGKRKRMGTKRKEQRDFL